MPELLVKDIGKRYEREWVFKNLSYKFTSKHYAITGANGSGKSTLLKALSGMLPLSEGKIEYRTKNPDFWFVSPYSQLIEEFDLKRMYALAFQRRLALGSFEAFIEKLQIPKWKAKPIGHFSSGQKQKICLNFAFHTVNDFLFLDEPTSNMDVKNIDWYTSSILNIDSSCVVIASNQPYEYAHCTENICIEQYK